MTTMPPMPTSTSTEKSKNTPNAAEPSSMVPAAPVVVTELPVDDPGHGWDEFVESQPGGTLFHMTFWRDLVRRFYGHRPRYLEARQAGRRVGVLPLFETRSPLSGKALVSVPYAVYGGPVSASEAATEALIDRVKSWVEQDGYRFAELRCQDAPPGDLPGTDLYTTFWKESPEDPEDCLASIPRKSRATTRQARDRHGLEFVEDPQHVARFHELFVMNKQKLGSPAHSLEYFQRLLAFPGNRCRLHSVLREGEVVMSVMSFCHGEVFNPYYSGSLPAADRMGASNFAYWKLMCIAAEERWKTFDFGRSRVDTGPYRFKKNMGFEPRPLAYRYVLGVGQEVPSINPSNPAFSLPKKIIQNLPAPLARGFGPWLLRLVP